MPTLATVRSFLYNWTWVGGNVARTLPSRSYGFGERNTATGNQSSRGERAKELTPADNSLGLNNRGKGQWGPVDPFQKRQPSRDQNEAERVNSEFGEENRQYSVHISMYKELPF